MGNFKGVKDKILSYIVTNNKNVKNLFLKKPGTLIVNNTSVQYREDEGLHNINELWLGDDQTEQDNKFLAAGYGVSYDKLKILNQIIKKYDENNQIFYNDGSLQSQINELRNSLQQHTDDATEEFTKYKEKISKIIEYYDYFARHITPIITSIKYTFITDNKNISIDGDIKEFDVHLQRNEKINNVKIEITGNPNNNIIQNVNIITNDGRVNVINPDNSNSNIFYISIMLTFNNTSILNLVNSKIFQNIFINFDNSSIYDELANILETEYKDLFNQLLADQNLKNPSLQIESPIIIPDDYLIFQNGSNSQNITINSYSLTDTANVYTYLPDISNLNEQIYLSIPGNYSLVNVYGISTIGEYQITSFVYKHKNINIYTLKIKDDNNYNKLNINNLKLQIKKNSDNYSEPSTISNNMQKNNYIRLQNFDFLYWYDFEKNDAKDICESIY